MSVRDPSPAVVCRGVRKSFPGRSSVTVAVDDVDLVIPHSVFFGLVGPNGAGKTTLLRAITGLTRPDAGAIDVAGVAVWPNPDAVRRLMGVLPDDLRLFERLSGRELLAYVGTLRGIETAELQRRVDELLDVLGFGASADELVADYSTGMRKKIGLGAALLHTPRILFLDEPFESVDPVSVRVLQDVLRAYQRAGGTVVLSSHVLDTVELLCSQVAIMNSGRVLRSGPIDEVCAGERLEDVFIDAVGGRTQAAALGWFDRNDDLAPVGLG